MQRIDKTHILSKKVKKHETLKQMNFRKLFWAMSSGKKEKLLQRIT